MKGIGVFLVLCGTLERIQQLAHLLLEGLYSAISNSVLCYEDLIFREETVNFGRAGDRNGCGYEQRCAHGQL